MPFQDLPHELRLAIFEQIDNWSNWPDFLAFRHTDRTNFMLLNNNLTVLAPMPSHEWKSKYGKMFVDDHWRRSEMWRREGPNLGRSFPPVNDKLKIKGLEGLNSDVSDDPEQTYFVEDYVIAYELDAIEGNGPFLSDFLTLLNIRLTPTPADTDWQPPNFLAWHCKARSALHFLLFLVWGSKPSQNLTIPKELYLDPAEFYQINSYEAFGVPLFDIEERFLSNALPYFEESDDGCDHGVENEDGLSESSSRSEDCCGECKEKAKHQHKHAYAEMLEKANDVVYWMSGMHERVEINADDFGDRDLVSRKIKQMSLVRQALWHLTQKQLHERLEPFIGVQESELKGREEESRLVVSAIHWICSYAEVFWHLNRYYDESVLKGEGREVWFDS
ncbi:hypothetical protein BJ508DRAFT_340458 [Ascobolus immersus RN42]|uniref:Uncharacterized protein n=1 Tax=Ascobolus immersus RN42 TaxID=1160509 RepID=A0A3N4HR80_ASCIM|nr:hypothetical protein BJ508DRAFT_340458 [Ascobolus immersus RN42]